jgi:bifunctional non-homologous end joining protein LigD
MYTESVLPSPFIRPCEPSSRDRLPKGDGWIYEVKFDGYRLQVHKTADTVTLYTARAPTGRHAFLISPHRSAHCAVALRSSTLNSCTQTASPHCIAKRINPSRTTSCSGHLISCTSMGNDLRIVSLLDRKRRLGHLIQGSSIGHFHYTEPFTNGLGLLAECEQRGLEGVVAKHINSVYRSGPSTAWIKVKCPTWREANQNRADLFAQ